MSDSVNILGISAFYHDSAAAFLQDGRIVACAQEERFSRKKHDSSFPAQAIEYCLKTLPAGKGLDCIVFYDKPFLTFERILSTYLAYAPLGLVSCFKSFPQWLKKKLWIKDLIASGLDYEGKILFTEHHQAHAASAFFPSPYQQAAFLTVDGVGEWATTSFGFGEDNHLITMGEMHFPHSLGLLYSAFTYFLGFKVNSGEYKVMGLAPYGRPVYKELILSELVELYEDGSFRLNMKYFNYCVGLTMANKLFEKLFDEPVRKPESSITQKHMDIARSIQEVTEEIVLRMVRFVHEKTKQENLCLAGGVALNCVANGRILRESSFKNLWIQPAAGDCGGALGAALFAWYQYMGHKRDVSGGKDSMSAGYLGPSYSDKEIIEFLKETNASYEMYEEDELVEKTACLLDQGNVIGWFQGRMEFGPRALGNRSILADARSSKMQETVNLKIKFREGFRPFAPSILEEKAPDFFEDIKKSPYMLLVAPVKEDKRKTVDGCIEAHGFNRLKAVRSQIPAVTHVDYSARVQTVEQETNSLFYKLLRKFEEKYHCPVLLNTSFNVRGEPIVCRPEEAYRCFMSTHMDYLVMGSFLIKKKSFGSGLKIQEAGLSSLDHFREHLDILVCPLCQGRLVFEDAKVKCSSCRRVYPIHNGIPLLFSLGGPQKDRGDVTDRIKSFYEKTPFPNYDDLDNASSLMHKANESVFAKLLNESLPFDIKILEAGCGTGQMSNFLGISHRVVFGTDMCLNSLQLAEDFKRKNSLSRVGFYQMNLFHPIFKEESFSLVICSGVLHHTSDPFGGFQSISRLVKKDGYILIGLHNKYGRFFTDMRRCVFNLFGDNFSFLDPRIREFDSAGMRKKAWFLDQYKNPHESKHTMDEVLLWFEKTGFRFINGIPKPEFYDRLLEKDDLFKKSPSGSRLSRVMVQGRLAFEGNAEGGLFLMMGQKI